MRALTLSALCLVAAMPAQAQVRVVQPDMSADQDELPQPLPQPAPVQVEPPDRVADSAIGQAGQRQRRDQAAPGLEPLGRIDSRIQNRVQSRIRNRIDRSYDPTANTTSPFEVAAEQTTRGPPAQ